ncbi:MAG: type II toxin-antitoxin system RelB/DinJ family antitoxin [Peptococcaceae bacterium]|jgi:addiction module RelB/DinJ family antitoxin|nr:type II toxin-antitoxin system RelB/DinJ family antitoxin [Peptococcaceae bacterium]
MIKNETLHIRVNDGVKLRAEKTLDLLGLSIAEAVNMLLHQITLVGGLPFDVKIPLAPESAIVRSGEELREKLSVGAEQIKAGKVIDAGVVMARLSDKYGFHG